MKSMDFVKMAIRVVVFMVTVVFSTQGAPPTSFDALIKAAQEAANNGKWDAVQNVLSNNYDGLQNIGSVRQLRPVTGGHVYGESELTFHSSVDQGGSKVENSAGHKIVNDDGRVKEFDFNPNRKEILRQLQERVENETKLAAAAAVKSKLQQLNDGTGRNFKLDHPVSPVFNIPARQGRDFGEQSFNDIVKTVNRQLDNKFQEMFKANFSGIRDLKPVQGGHVFGQSDLTIHSSSNLDGRNIQHSSGHRLINTDGRVNEFDFKPDDTDLARQLKQQLSLLMAKELETSKDSRS